MQITGLPEEADDDTPITLLLTKEEPVYYEPEDPATVQVINGKFFCLFFSFFSQI
jgi:hypothetical protein